MITLGIFIMFAAVSGITWSMLLTEPGELFDFWPALVYRATRNKKLQKILYACEKCVAGQIALWGYVILYLPQYRWTEHLGCIIFAIFTAHIFAKIMEKWLS